MKSDVRRTYRSLRRGSLERPETVKKGKGSPILDTSVGIRADPGRLPVLLLQGSGPRLPSQKTLTLLQLTVRTTRSVSTIPAKAVPFVASKPGCFEHGKGKKVRSLYPTL